MAETASATPPVELKYGGRSGKPFELLEYTHDSGAESIGLQAAQALGLPANVVFKTLMVDVGDEPCIAIVPSDRELNLKVLAAAAGGKSAAMMRQDDAERISGGTRGYGHQCQPHRGAEFAGMHCTWIALGRPIVRIKTSLTP